MALCNVANLFLFLGDKANVLVSQSVELSEQIQRDKYEANTTIRSCYIYIIYFIFSLLFVLLVIVIVRDYINYCI